MPFRSEAQRRYMHANMPETARRWEEHTPDAVDLPEHVEERDGDAEARQRRNMAREKMGECPGKGHPA